MIEDNHENRNTDRLASDHGIATVDVFSNAYRERIASTIDLWRSERHRLVIALTNNIPGDGLSKQDYFSNILSLTYKNISSPKDALDRLQSLERSLEVFWHLGINQQEETRKLIAETLVFIEEFRALIDEWIYEKSELAA